MANHETCDVCGRECGSDDYAADGYWTICDECWQRAPEYVRDQLSGITSNRQEDAERWIRAQSETLK